MPDVYKMINATKEEACRTAEADAIRAKTGESADIAFDFANDKGFADAIAAIETGEPSPLPSGYTQMEYLESSGTQHLVLDYFININTEFEVEEELYSGEGSYYASWGQYAAPEAPHTDFLRNTNQAPVTSAWNSIRYFYHTVGNGGDKMVSVPSAFQCLERINALGSRILLGGKFIKLYTAHSTPPEFGTSVFKAVVFGIKTNTSVRHTITKIYKFGILENDEYIIKLIPAMRDSDNVLGMYDIVNDIFYTNVGTGEFAGGALT